MVNYSKTLGKLMVEATPTIVKNRGYKTDLVEGVIEELMHHIDNHRRQPAPPPPAGGISLRAAERKYGVHHGTISRWVKRGLVRVLSTTKNWLYVEEKTLFELIKKYKKAPGKGKRTIDTKE